MKRNPTFTKLPPSYLFSEVKKRVNEYQKNHPNSKLISLAVGDTTQPLPKVVAEAMEEKARLLSTAEGYRGYGAEQGEKALREKIAETFYPNLLEAQDIFVSDGAKCDLGRLQILFPPQTIIGVQDPAYPVYFDTSTIMNAHVKRLAMIAENDFFFDLEEAAQCNVLFFSSPNNPTGTALSSLQYEKLIRFAKDHKILLILDAAYNLYIEDPSLPRSIYEIEGGKDVAIELGSFSKLVNFTGVRLGWTAIPPNLKYEDGNLIRNDWQRIVTTFFNGASNIVQAGGIAALTPPGLKGIEETISYYKQNAALLRQALLSCGYEVHGGLHCPFLWVKFPSNPKTSWEMFDYFLYQKNLITTPGSGFGPNGEGYIRFSSLGKRHDILTSIERLCN